VVLYIVHALNVRQGLPLSMAKFIVISVARVWELKRGSKHVESLDDIVLTACDASIIKEPRVVSCNFTMSAFLLNVLCGFLFVPN